MRLLLDTHALLWTLTKNSKLSLEAARHIDLVNNQIMVSPVSAYEIHAKHTLGKLPEAAALVADFDGELALMDAEWLPISPARAKMAGQLPMTHRDPFDRLLIAQSLVERIPLVSNEAVFDTFGVERIW